MLFILADGSKNFLAIGDKFRSTATNKVFKIGMPLTCNSANVVYLAQCGQCSYRVSVLLI